MTVYVRPTEPSKGAGNEISTSSATSGYRHMSAPQVRDILKAAKERGEEIVYTSPSPEVEYSMRKREEKQYEREMEEKQTGVERIRDEETGLYETPQEYRERVAGLEEAPTKKERYVVEYKGKKYPTSDPDWKPREYKQDVAKQEETKEQKPTTFSRLDEVRREEETKVIAARTLEEYPQAKSITIKRDSGEYKFTPIKQEAYTPTPRGRIGAEPKLLISTKPTRTAFGGRPTIRLGEVYKRAAMELEKTKSPITRIGLGMGLTSAEFVKGAVKGPILAASPQTYKGMLKRETYAELGKEIRTRPHKIGEIPAPHAKVKCSRKISTVH